MNLEFVKKRRGLHFIEKRMSVELSYGTVKKQGIIKGGNLKKVKVILTIAHLDHDETNHDVTDDRLKAMCQLCHLRYDAKEKASRRRNK